MAGSITAHASCTIKIPMGKWSGGNVDLDKMIEAIKREAAEKVRQIMRDSNTHSSLIGNPVVELIVYHE